MSTFHGATCWKTAPELEQLRSFWISRPTSSLAITFLSWIDWSSSTSAFHILPRNYLVFIIPPPAKFSSFEKLSQPFQNTVWITLVACYLLGVGLIILIIKFASRVNERVFGAEVKSPLMDLLVITFGLSQPTLPSKCAPRFILIQIVVFFLVIRSAYQGSLYRFLQSDEVHVDVKSFHELIEKDYKFYIGKSFADLIQQQTNLKQRWFFSFFNNKLELNIFLAEKSCHLKSLGRLLDSSETPTSKQRSLSPSRIFYWWTKGKPTTSLSTICHTILSQPFLSSCIFKRSFTWHKQSMTSFRSFSRRGWSNIGITAITRKPTLKLHDWLNWLSHTWLGPSKFALEVAQLLLLLS